MTTKYISLFLIVILLGTLSGCHTIGTDTSWRMSLRGETTVTDTTFRFDGVVGIAGQFSSNTAKGVKVQFVSENESVIKEVMVGNLGAGEQTESIDVTLNRQPETVAVKLDSWDKSSGKPSEVEWYTRQSDGTYTLIRISGENETKYTY